MQKPPAGWTPFLVREGVVAGDALEGPHDGVPDWLFPSLWKWTWPQLFTKQSGYWVKADWEFIRWFERKCRFSFGVAEGSTPKDGYRYVQHHCQHTDGIFLALVDALVAGKASQYRAAALEDLLHEAGSLWRVDPSTSPPALVRRVSETLEATVLQEVQRGEASGELLAIAWRAAFGQSPNSSEAYRHAVRAVEAAGGPLVLPRDPARTLGKMIAHLRDAEASWRFTLKGNAAEAESVRPVREMMAALWTSQYDRHVTDDAPLHVTPEEAETAVTLAAALVHWFSSGAISRVE